MKKLTKIIAATGIVAGLGVAGLPLVSYAANTASTTTDVSVKIRVSDIISITASNNIDLGTLAPNSKTANGSNKKTILTVISNSASGYVVTASAEKLKSGNYEIGYGTPGGTDQSGAMLSVYGMSTEDQEYRALSLVGGKDQPSKTKAEGGDLYNLYFGASVSASQPTGEYTGIVTFTATNK